LRHGTGQKLQVDTFSGCTAKDVNKPPKIGSCAQRSGERLDIASNDDGQALQVRIVVHYTGAKPRDSIRQLEQSSIVQGMEVTPKQDSVRSFVLPRSPIAAMQMGRLERFRDIAAGNGAPSAIRREYSLSEGGLLLPNQDLHVPRDTLFGYRRAATISSLDVLRTSRASHDTTGTGRVVILLHRPRNLIELPTLHAGRAVRGLATAASSPAADDDMQRLPLAERIANRRVQLERSAAIALGRT
jgi:hypothetical protein